MKVRQTFLLLAGLLLVLPSHVRAEFRPKVEVLAVQGKAVIYVNRQPAIGLDDFDRANIVAGRIAQLANLGINPEAVDVVRTPRGAAIVAAGLRIIEVTNEQAKLQNTTSMALARRWALNLRRLLSLPGLTAEPARLLIPLSESRTLRVGGAASGPIEVMASGAPVNAVVDQVKRTVTVTGLTVGDGMLTLRCEGAELNVPFAIRKYAAVVGSARVAYTGSGPSKDRLEKLIADYALRAVAVEPGARVQLDEPVRLQPGLIPQQVAVRIKAEGEGYIPVRADVPVSLTVENVPPKEASVLFYSNDPERVRRFGGLYAAPLQLDQPARLLYHHQNVMPRSFDLSVSVVNYGNLPARVQVIEGIAPAMVDTVQVGHRAAARFMPNLFSNSGFILELAPGERYPILLQTIPSGFTGSGLFQLRLLAGESVWVFVRAEATGWSVPERPPSPSRHIYINPRMNIQERYVVGQRWAFIPIGKYSIERVSRDGVLDGNYGVLYDINVKVENPTSEPANVEVLFEPSAGVARGVFWIDGVSVETQHLLPPREYPIARYPLQPNSSRDIRILTMPLAGSHYPARIIVRALRNTVRRPSGAQEAVAPSS